MSTLTLTLRTDRIPLGRISLANIVPSTVSGKSANDITQLTVSAGAQSVTLGDLFSISGEAGDTIVIAGGSDKLDDVGAGMKSGAIIVEGDIGGYGGRRMSGGRLEVKGNAGPYLASRLSDGLVTVSGSAGDFVGGIKAGEKFGMTGGIVIVDGNIGARAGDRMRRGTIIARGKFGPHAGSRMMGGTLWTETGFGPEPGPLLRRGTLIGPSVDNILPTFVDGGKHDLGVLSILSKHMADILGALAPQPLPRTVRKLSGDMATIGKGELLLTKA